MVFGAASSVLRYKVFSRTLEELINKLLGMPIPLFFDDSGAIALLDLAESSLMAFTPFSPKLGTQRKIAKSEFGHIVSFCG